MNTGQSEPKRRHINKRPMKTEQTGCSETSAHKKYLWRRNRQGVSKRRHIKFRLWGINQKKEYNIHNKAKVWNKNGVKRLWFNSEIYKIVLNFRRWKESPLLPFPGRLVFELLSEVRIIFEKYSWPPPHKKGHFWKLFHVLTNSLLLT